MSNLRKRKADNIFSRNLQSERSQRRLTKYHKMNEKDKVRHLFTYSISVCASCREIIDNTGKENGIDVVMPERTYHLIAESAEDAR